ncbi:MAG: FtsK/SpoIIIE domain-containing protein [Planctomycetota bacterium]|nr:FtsK/SpoIIIE domain-containing protein [Planctomycetota bacterium]
MNPRSYDADVLRSQLAILRKAAADRSAQEKAIRSAYDSAVQTAATEQRTATDSLRQERAAEIESLKKEYADKLAHLAAKVAAERTKLDEQRAQAATQITRQADAQEKKLHDDDQFEETQAREVAKEKKKKPQRLFLKSEQELGKIAGALEDCENRSRSFVATTCGSAGGGEPVAEVPTTDDFPQGVEVLKTLERLATGIVEQTKALCGLPAAKRVFAGGLKASIIILPVILAMMAAGGVAFGALAAKIDEPLIIAATAGTAVLILGGGLGGGLWWLTRARRQVRQRIATMHRQLAGEIATARRCLGRSTEFIAKRRDAQLRQAEEEIQAEIAKRKAALQAALAAVAAKREKAATDIEAKVAAGRAAIDAKEATAKTQFSEKYPTAIATLEKSLDDELARIERTAAETVTAAATARDAQWAEMVAAWRSARTETAAVYKEAAAIDAAAFLPWEELAKPEVPLPIDIPPGLRFGSLALALEKIPGGISPTPELNAFGPLEWPQPATLPFPQRAALLIKTTADQHENASAMLQALTLRIATGIPPGQSRFTIIDPLGLGKQFAGFMHLADHDELLVTSRIWTEPQQIEERLGDMSEQMEVVIQKYLRNEYESIGAYNAEAEVPEPYRFVVVANFPANFTETSARRLMSIAASGGRCGVYVIVSVDTRQMMPSGFSLDELDRLSTTLILKDGSFSWCDEEFSQWPLTVESAPPDAVFTEIIQRVGKAAKAAKRVEVPFDRVAPPEEEWWHGSTASEVLAPLGPAGAKKLQYLKLGKGTSQHALIAGKTGSGKSTLMHAMITSLALQYSPNEIQFYLIDFKKGVEFKLYDHYALPHARVIAIESEREFGLSVLEQLDRELKRRGDLFRELSVQDVAGFRKTNHPDPMPRILLIIDEFQEIFVEDDKIAQDASLILDRLVRQGRAFGMHVLLGSQTLGGSYSLPRATMGQMAIRVALQCNEADSSLILSEDNTAARLLTRPGEAIYNDANGMVEGNNPFQVVFLNDERRERYLGALRKLADQRTDIPQVPRIVFDGNEAADPAGNPLLNELLVSGTVHGKQLVAPLAWIGDAIAIKDPTAAIFRRQGGANLLIVGQREDLGTSLLAMAMVSLAVGHDPYPGGALGKAARFVLLEPAIAEEKPDIMLAQLAAPLPHDIEQAGRLGVADALERLAGEVQRRIDNQVLDGEAVFLVIRDLGRFRELRKEEGGFGFSFGSEKKAGPAEHFATILRDGPPVGVHAIIWCDSLTNLMRTFDRGAIKEFELRTVFQMSGTDSSQLIDSPAASKLGPQRALFIHEETGTLEKFRPYAFPSPEWLTSVSERLRARPQGTPQERPAAPLSASSSEAESATKPASGPTARKGDDSFGLTGGGFGDFNFTKMLDDLPGGDASSDDDPASETPTSDP